MLKQFLNIIFLFILMGNPVFAHNANPRYHVIVDTDGDLSDMRAISMLLAGNDIRVLAVSCSHGTLTPEQTYQKVKGILHGFYHEGIPAGIVNGAGTRASSSSSFDDEIPWSYEETISNFNHYPDSEKLLTDILEKYETKINLIALGSLDTYYAVLKSRPDLQNHVERIIWFKNGLSEEKADSPESYRYLKDSGIRLDLVSNNNRHLIIDKNYLGEIKNTNSIYARQIEYVHNHPPVSKKLNNSLLHMGEDLAPLYLTVPIIFDVNVQENIHSASINLNIPADFINEAIATLLKSTTAVNNRVFIDFPVDQNLYQPGYAEILDSTLKKFGPVEWKAICLTNEIHGHTGIYSIIGAKMGIRAMEYFNIGINNLKITSFAGNKPPLSCFNDGLQISTGSTIGQGLITISDSVNNVPGAVFEFNGREVHISLKPEIAAQMKKEIKYGVENYGLENPEYWRYIEKLAMQYWTEMDRHKIMVIDKNSY